MSHKTVNVKFEFSFCSLPTTSISLPAQFFPFVLTAEAFSFSFSQCYYFDEASCHRFKMSFLLSRRSSTNSLIGTRIQLLTSQQKVSSDKDCSPTLKDLREREKNRVQRFSDIFERKAWVSRGNGCNWWLNEKTASPTGARSSTPKKSAVFIFPGPLSAPTKPPRVSVFKIDDIAKLRELLKVEQQHIEDIRYLILKLDCLDSSAIGQNQKKIRENKFCIFGDLKAIQKLHAVKIVPQMKRLIKSNGKCVDFIKFIAKLIDDGAFYCYVKQKMMEKTLKQFRVDPLNSIPNMNPLKMVETYHEWISNVCNELIKRPAENSDDIAVCMEAEKKLTDLMDYIADAEEVTRITQVSEVPLEAQFKIYNIIKRNEQEVKSPMLMLLPNKHFKYGYRYPVGFVDKILVFLTHEISFLFTARHSADGEIRENFSSLDVVTGI